ncbi:MAG: hypothetical protein WD600_04770, partial [Pseudohongiella sp.]
QGQAYTDADSAHWQQRFERHQARSQHDALALQERKLQKLQSKTKALADGESVSRHDPAKTNAATSVAGKTQAQIQAEIAAAVARTRARKAALQADNKPGTPEQTE